MRLLGIVILLVCFSFSSFALQQGDTSDNVSESTSFDDSSHYISDNLFIFMHTGPGRNYRILGSIEAGLPVTKTDSAIANDFVEITDSEGRTGWIQAEYLSDQASRRVLVEQYREEALDATAVVRPLQQNLNTAKRSISTLTSSNEDLTKQLAKTEQDLADLQAEIEGTEEDQETRVLMVGGGLVAAGILLGLIVAYLPKKRNRSDSWMN